MPRVFRTDGTEVLSLIESAYRVGRDGNLSNPNTASILDAAAELAGSSRDMYNLDREFVERLLAAFNRGNEDRSFATAVDE